MGVNLGEIVPKKKVDISDLKGKSVAIDAYNALYQFLAIIRQRDGTPLKNSKGEVTSHLSGLFYRSVNLIEQGIRPIYVFDGKPPEQKFQTIEKRKEIKEDAREKYIDAKSRGDFKEAKKYSQMTSSLKGDMVNSSKELLTSMGIPYIEAPSEGEAQAAYVVLKGDADLSASQDYDSILFGAPSLVRNLTISGKRKIPGKDLFVDVVPEIIDYENVLNYLNLSRNQLIEVAILIGTDYNPGGIKGIGPKKAIEIVKEGKFGEYGEFDQIINLFLDPTVSDNYTISFEKPDKDKIIKILCDKYEFSELRVEKGIERIAFSLENTLKQKTLDKYF
ncbi:MAG: Flap endonuclease 1 [Candidatus Methanofastidiosum methylothiophilum]|uniref:Flap endonuclease 1 n=1 Tax=Candidatus Methanofastidiosum methylothiophilum TaxID=1705564 RepID=A0A150J1M9_9EURY|nr:MAG: Flap endonuclease 1 [Candidatus Methanofastidiosum methylthiophilus]KYC48649.1 MAG: Flap endonuclease 1 [Candidatus Methanofastidiosum methylthiophilus]KYC51146.1 MAG: Flap endonuclease 1 [Candidatus Methanofastidiosum methylthiophilus]